MHCAPTQQRVKANLLSRFEKEEENPNADEIVRPVRQGDNSRSHSDENRKHDYNDNDPHPSPDIIGEILDDDNNGESEDTDEDENDDGDVLDYTAVTVAELSPAVKQVLDTITNCKSTVKYVKKVRTSKEKESKLATIFQG